MTGRSVVFGILALTAGGIFFLAGQAPQNRAGTSATAPAGVSHAGEGHADHLHSGGAAHAELHANNLQHDQQAPGNHQAAGDHHTDMQGEMNPPALHRIALIAFSLPELQKELALSPTQVNTLKQLRSSLESKGKDTAGKIASRQRELDLLLKGETSRTQTVRKLFSEIAGLRSQMQYASFDTLNKMKLVLDAAQKTKLAATTGVQLHQMATSQGSMKSVHELLTAMGEMQ